MFYDLRGQQLGLCFRTQDTGPAMLFNVPGMIQYFLAARAVGVTAGQRQIAGFGPLAGLGLPRPAPPHIDIKGHRPEVGVQLCVTRTRSALPSGCAPPREPFSGHQSVKDIASGLLSPKRAEPSYRRFAGSVNASRGMFKLSGIDPLELAARASMPSDILQAKQELVYTLLSFQGPVEIAIDRGLMLRLFGG